MVLLLDGVHAELRDELATYRDPDPGDSHTNSTILDAAGRENEKDERRKRGKKDSEASGGRERPASPGSLSLAGW
jgi:hypothetical protein